MAKVHFILQGKGGVGKSKVASALAQYLLELGLPVVCLDTDPVNNTLAGYKEFEATVLKIMDGDSVNARMFDKLIEIIFSADKDTHVVVDNGASSFIPLMSYLAENDAVKLLQENGHEVFIHTVITGGQALVDTVAGLDNVCERFASAKICVWLNLYFGDIVDQKTNKSFESFLVYKEHHKKFHSIIQIPSKNKSTFGKDIEELLARRETYDAGINSSLPIMARQRIKTYWSELKQSIEDSGLLAS